MMDIFDDEILTSFKVQANIKDNGISEVKKFLEDKLNLEVILDYTGPDGTHFE